MEPAIAPKRQRLDIHHPEGEDSDENTTVRSKQPVSQLHSVTATDSSEEDEDNGDTSSGSDDDDDDDEEEEEGDNDMRTQVKEFFAELDLEEGKQKRRLMEEGVRIPRRKSMLPAHLHSVMGNANLRLARGDTGAAIELCMEIIRQGKLNY